MCPSLILLLPAHPRCSAVLDCSSAGVIINAFKAFMDSKAYQGQVNLHRFSFLTQDSSACRLVVLIV